MSKSKGYDFTKPTSTFEIGIQKALHRIRMLDFGGNRIVPTGIPYKGLQPNDFHHWNHAPGNDDPHTDYEREAFMQGGWTT